jgi:phage gpG-like protein
VRTGALRDSLTQPVAPGHVEEMDRQTLSMGSRLPYALFHQTGTRRMPARPIIVLSDDRAAKWTDFVRSAMEEKTHLLGAKELA